MNKNLTILLAFFFSIGSFAFAANNSGLILPMPGQNTKPVKPNKNDRPNNSKKTQPALTPTIQVPSKYDPNKVFIPLPEIMKDRQTGKVTIKKVPAVNKPVYQKPSTPPVVIIPASNQPNINITNTDPLMPLGPFDVPDSFPVPENEVTVTSTVIAPPMITTNEPKILTTQDSGELIIFPKDTGSAIFMVMKSWKCDDYDATTLLEHAVGVYAEEASDPFQIKGLPTESAAYDVTVEEEDITLDELLDLVAQKAGRDWGVDINSRTIHFYAPGVKSNSYDLW